MATLLFPLFRGLEYLSINIFKTGPFPNTERLQSSRPGTGLIAMALTHPSSNKRAWLSDLAYPRAFYNVLYATCGISLLVYAYSMTWWTYAYKWFGSSDTFKTIRITILYHTPFPIDPGYYTLPRLISSFFLYLSILTTLLSTLAIISPPIFNWRHRRLTRRQSLFLLLNILSGLSTLYLNHYNTVENYEIIYIIIPAYVGGWFCVAAAWGPVGELVAGWRRGGSGEGDKRREVGGGEERMD